MEDYCVSDGSIARFRVIDSHFWRTWDIFSLRTIGR